MRRVSRFNRLCQLGGIFLLLVIVAGAPANAQELVPPRLQIGINLLPAVIAANNGLASVDPDKALPIYLVFRDDLQIATKLQQELDRIERIRKHVIDVQAIKIDDLLALQPEPHSTIYISEQLDDRLPELIAFSREKRALLFSPFEGDIERGVATGFRVTDKVLPMVNKEALKQSKIQLKAFFLRIAVQYE